MMISAKQFNAMHNLFRPIGKRDNQHFLDASIGFRRALAPRFRRSEFVAGFLAYGMPKFCKAYPLASFGRKSRFVGSAIDVKSALAKRLEGVQPVLLTFNLKHGQYKFDHLKCKGVFTVLVERILQGLRMMLIVSQRIKMLCLSGLQVDRATDIKAACERTGNTIDATRGGNARGHVLTPLVSTLCCVVARQSRSLLFGLGSYSSPRQRSHYSILSKGVKSGC